MFLTPARRHDPELMDAPGLPDAEIAHAYDGLARVNRQLGNRRTLNQAFDAFARDQKAGQSVTVLDVGAGDGDLADSLAQHAARRGRSASVLALDHDPLAARRSARRGRPTVRGDALRLPLADRSIDLVVAAKFAHHFHGEGLARLLAEMSRVAASRVVVIDIRRHWVAYWGFVAWSRVMTTSRLVRYDGPLSVLRGFTRAELQEAVADLIEFRWTVTSRWGFQLVLTGERRLDLAEPRPS